MNQKTPVPVLQEQEVEKIYILKTSQIVPNPKQPRTDFDDADLEEFGEGILLAGQKEAIVVRPIGDDLFELVSGERRWRACIKKGMPTIKARVQEVADKDLHFESVLYNFGRRKLGHKDTLNAIVNEVDGGRDVKTIAVALGKSVGWVDTYLNLSRKLAPELLEILENGPKKAGSLLFGDARELAKLPTHKRQIDRHEKTKGLSPPVRKQLLEKAVTQTRTVQRKPRAVCKKAEGKNILSTVELFHLFVKNLSANMADTKIVFEKMLSYDREKLEEVMDACAELLNTHSSTLNILNNQVCVDE